jgi:hypothetical protein
MTVGRVIGILGSGVVIGLVVGCFLHGSLSNKVFAEPHRARAIPALAPGESLDRTRDAPGSAPLFAATNPDEPSAQRISPAGSASDAAPLNVASVEGSSHLIDRARTQLMTVGATTALALLVQHAHRFPGSSGAEDRRQLVRLVCADPAARGSVECASLSPDSTSE